MSSQDKATLLQEIKKDLIFCKKITHKFGPNFSVGFRFLPKEKRRAVYASYACCRLIDDLVDEGEKPTKDILKKWEEEIENAYAGKPTHPATRALNFYLKKFPIPKNAFLNLIEGCKMDLEKKRYNSFEELLAYSEKVATSISDISISIFGAKEKDAYVFGRRLATAFQLTNIIRDVKEDLEKGRIYLPLNEIEEFGLKEIDFISLNLSKEMENFLRNQCKRVISFFETSKPLVLYLEKDSVLCVILMHSVYFEIIKKIYKNPLVIFKKRVKLGIPEKIFLVISKIFTKKLV
jgi:phytoene synthase